MTFDMLFDFGELGWIGIIVGTIVMVALGALWWGPLFGKQWTEATGEAMEAKPPPEKVAWTVAYSFLFNVGLAYFTVAEVDNEVEHAVVAAIIFGIALIMPVLFSGVVWSSYKRIAFVIDAGYWTVAVFLAVLVQAFLV